MLRVREKNITKMLEFSLQISWYLILRETSWPFSPLTRRQDCPLDNSMLNTILRKTKFLSSTFSLCISEYEGCKCWHRHVGLAASPLDSPELEAPVLHELVLTKPHVTTVPRLKYGPLLGFLIILIIYINIQLNYELAVGTFYNKAFVISSYQWLRYDQIYIYYEMMWNV